MPAPSTAQTPELDARRKSSLMRVRRLAWMLDDAIELPLLRTRVGLDAIIGLVPVVGDAVGVALSGLVVAEAVRLRAPTGVIMRMAGNVAVDFVVGVVPIAGDLADLYWRANRRNLRVLENWLGKTTNDDSRPS